MYGGLFGDLPATKKKQEPSNQAKSEGTSATNDSTNPNAAPSSMKQVTEPPSLGIQKQAGAFSSNQILKAVGAGGTSMAFVPAAARRKKRPRAPSPTVPNAVKNDTTRQELAAITTSSKTESWQPSVYTTQSSETKISGQHQPASAPAVLNIHEQSSGSANHYYSQLPEEEGDEEENEEIRNIYDPYIPNDLLQYWDRKKLAKEREAMERETKEALEQQRRLRLELEQQRHALQQKGDYDSLLQQHDQRGGRGRGRGVSNLPAWLVQKKRKEQELGNSSTST